MNICPLIPVIPPKHQWISLSTRVFASRFKSHLIPPLRLPRPPLPGNFSIQPRRSVFISVGTKLQPIDLVTPLNVSRINIFLGPRMFSLLVTPDHSSVDGGFTCKLIQRPLIVSYSLLSSIPGPLGPSVQSVSAASPHLTGCDGHVTWSTTSPASPATPVAGSCPRGSSLPC